MIERITMNKKTVKTLCDALASSELFCGISGLEMEIIFLTGGGQLIRVSAGEKITDLIMKGKPLTYIISGEVEIVRERPGSEAMPVIRKTAGSCMGLYYFNEMQTPPVTREYVTDTDAELFRLDNRCFTERKYLGDTLFEKLSNNLKRLMSVELTKQYRQLEILRTHSIREKLLMYLWEEREKNGKNEFLIPYTREELAEHLYANRTALSREIGRMIKEGLIETKGKHFTLIA